jgi:hypothetical protein
MTKFGNFKSLFQILKIKNYLCKHMSNSTRQKMVEINVQCCYECKKLGLDLGLFATWPNLGATWPKF